MQYFYTRNAIQLSLFLHIFCILLCLKCVFNFKIYFKSIVQHILIKEISKRKLHKWFDKKNYKTNFLSHIFLFCFKNFFTCLRLLKKTRIGIHLLIFKTKILNFFWFTKIDLMSLMSLKTLLVYFITDKIIV